MIRLDTISLMIPEESVSQINRDAFITNIQIDDHTGEELMTKKAKSTYLPIGVSQITYKDERDYILTISAKTLKDNYLEGINLNTWERAIRGASEILDIDTQKIWDINTRILRCDTTDNIEVQDLGYSKRDICQSLYENRMNQRFVSKWYESTKKLGLEFAGTQKEKNRIICYDKLKDLEKTANKKFMESLMHPIEMRDRASSTLRFETNHTTKRSIIDRFKVKENNLREVLHSNTPVNHNFLKKVLSTDYQISLFEELKKFDGDPHTFIYRKGLENIIKELNYDEGQVKRFIKELYGDANYKYHWYNGRQPIKKLLMEMKLEKPEERGKETESLCKEIMERLRIAV